MKSIYKFIYYFNIVAVFCFTMIFNCTEAFAAETKWQESYIEVIENRPEREGTSTSSSYCLYNIDDDEIPELLMWDSSNYVQALYTYYDGKAILCDEFSYKTTLLFYSTEDGYFWSSVTESAIWSYNNFYKLEDGSCTVLYSFCHDLSDEENGVYKINDVVVSKEGYENKMTEIEAEYPILWEYTINIKLGYSYDEIRQYLLNSMEEQTVVTKTSAEDLATTVTQAVSESTEADSTSFNEASELCVANVSSENIDTTLPQTGHSNWYKLIELIAVGVLGIGVVFIKFGLKQGE